MSENEEILVPPSSPPNYDYEEDDGEDLFATADGDNEYDAQLDRYENCADDDEDVNHLTVGERQQAEREMYERDVRAGRQAQMPMNMESPGGMQQQAQAFSQQAQLTQHEMEEGQEVNLEDYDGPLVAWLNEDRVQREVKRKFREFLTAFRDEKSIAVYPKAIQEMAVKNKRSLDVSFLHLSCAYPILAIWTADCPGIMLELFDDVATMASRDIFPGYQEIQEKIRVRLTNLPVTDKLRDLRHNHLNMLIRVTGVVTRRTNVFPQLEAVRFDCMKCGYMMGPYLQRGLKDEVRPPNCPQCSSKGPFRLNVADTIYRNYQKLTLQESPGTVQAGRVPRSREVILVDDLVDTVRPGEEIDVTGIYANQFDTSINIQTGFPVFMTVIEANYIERREDAFTADRITEDDKKMFRKLSKRPDLSSLIINSIAPSIYGYDYIKQAIAFAMFAGQEKTSKKGKHRVRGDINVLILGDPGVGKSQFLKWVENVAPRSVYATGKGASAVGLTAGVRRDPLTGEWTLEGGALVLADRGVCLIDEFDKMNEQDRTSIHEAMEQQSISISKAGIVTRLQARCAVIAAANPIGGRYDGSLSFIENVDLTDPILSRFDILAIVRDTVDPVRDEQLATWVVGNHTRAHPHYTGPKEGEEEEKERPEHLDTEMLRKYVMWAKTSCFPKLFGVDKTKISRFYADLRQKSMEGGGVPIAVRHIESVLRMSEASARMHLRSNVVEEDVDIAIRTLLQSFIATQKRSVKMPLKKHFQSYLHYKRDNIEILMHILQEEVLNQTHFMGIDSSKVEIPLSNFQKKASQYKINDVNILFNQKRFLKSGFSFNVESKKISKSFT